MVLGCRRVSTLPFRPLTVGAVLLGVLNFMGTEVFLDVCSQCSEDCGACVFEGSGVIFLRLLAP